MKCFIFERIEQCTNSYHPQGGLVIFAEDINGAKKLINDANTKDNSVYHGAHIEVTEKEWGDVKIFDMHSGTNDELFYFEDSGCC